MKQKNARPLSPEWLHEIRDELCESRKDLTAEEISTRGNRLAREYAKRLGLRVMRADDVGAIASTSTAVKRKSPHRPTAKHPSGNRTARRIA